MFFCLQHRGELLLSLGGWVLKDGREEGGEGAVAEWNIGS